MTKEYVNVRLTWNTGYSRIVKMPKCTYDFYVRDRNLLHNDYYAINWSNDEGSIGVSFNGLIIMEIVEE